MEKYGGGSNTLLQYAPGIAALGYYGTRNVSNQGKAIIKNLKRKQFNPSKYLRMRRKMSKYRRRRPRMRTRRRGRFIRTRPLTAQNDSKVTYVKRGSRRIRRNVRRRAYRFETQLMKKEPSNIWFAVDVDKIEWPENQSEYFGAFVGLTAQNNYDNNLGEVWNKITDAPSADNKVQTTKARLASMSLRVVIRNTTVPGDANASATVDLDVYEVMCVRDIPADQWVSGLGIEEMIANERAKLRDVKGMYIDVSTAGAGISNPQTNAGVTSGTIPVGDTLFNNITFSRYWKVMRAMKIQLPSEGITEFEIRDNKDRTIMREHCFGVTALAAKAYLTRGFIFNVNGRAFYSGTPEVLKFSGGTLNIEQYVRYNVKRITGKAATLVYDGV